MNKYKTYEENNKNYSEAPSEHVSLLHESFLMAHTQRLSGGP